MEAEAAMRGREVREGAERLPIRMKGGRGRRCPSTIHTLESRILSAEREREVAMGKAEGRTSTRSADMCSL